MNGLTLIYHFQSSQNQDQEFRPASYRVIYFFNEEGFVNHSTLLELLKAFPEAGVDGMTFLNLEDLKAFALRVGQELQSPQVKLISVQDYNIGLDGAKDLRSYRELFGKYGESLVNETAVKKKGLLGKFFG